MAWLDALTDTQREAALVVWRESSKESERLHERARNMCAPGCIPAGSGAYDYIDPALAIDEWHRALRAHDTLADAYEAACEACAEIIRKRNARHPHSRRGANHFQRWERTCDDKVMRWMHRFRDAVKQRGNDDLK